MITTKNFKTHLSMNFWENILELILLLYFSLHFFTLQHIFAQITEVVIKKLITVGGFLFSLDICPPAVATD